MLKGKNFIGTIFSFIGLVFVILGFSFFISTYTFLNKGTKTSGQVTKLVSMKSQMDRDWNRDLYYPKISFTDQKGEVITFLSNSGSNPSRYSVGNTVTVLYKQDSPQNVVIASFDNLWLPTLIFGGAGVIVLVIGLIIVSSQYRKCKLKIWLYQNGRLIQTQYLTTELLTPVSKSTALAHTKL